MTIVIFPGVVLLGLLCAICFQRLRHSNYPVLISALLSALVIAQGGLLAGTNAALLALAVCGLAMAAGAFAARESARTVMAVGAALSGIQLVHPIGAAMAAMFVPVAVGLRASRADNVAGTTILLLFVPVVTAVALAALYWKFHFNAAVVLQSLTPRPLLPWTVRDFGPLANIAAVAPAIPAFAPMLRRGDRTPALGAVLCVVLVLAAADMVAIALGVVRDPRIMLAAVAPVVAIAIGAWPQQWRTPGRALSAASASFALSWLILLLL